MLQQIKVPKTIVFESNQSGWILKNLEATLEFGKALVKALEHEQILLLEGPLGVGKTSLVKGIGQGFSIDEPITSPTFALSHHYLKGIRALIHLDLYRVESQAAANELFLEEEETAKILGGLMIVEWPSRLSIKINDACHIKLKYLANDGGRIIQLISSDK